MPSPSFCKGLLLLYVITAVALFLYQLPSASSSHSVEMYEAGDTPETVLITNADGSEYAPMDVSHFLAPVGTIVMWLNDDIPDGWVLCDGATLPSEASDLLILLGTTKSPDLRGYVISGSGAALQLGEHLRTTGYTETKLYAANIPSHTHELAWEGDTDVLKNGRFQPLPDSAFIPENHGQCHQKDDSSSHDKSAYSVGNNNESIIRAPLVDVELPTETGHPVGTYNESFSLMQKNIALNYIIKY